MHAFTATTSSQPFHSSSGVKYQQIWHEEYLEIYLAPEGKFIRAVWHGLPGKQQIMAGAEKILESVTQYGCSKVINDVSRVEGLFTEAVDWVITDFAPRLNATGVNTVAWIYAENSVSRYSADAVLSRSITDTISIVFDNLENAERWILAV